MKKNKELKTKNIKLTEEEEKIAKKKAILTIALCILWPLTLLVIIPNIQDLIGQYVYYGLLVISILNVYLTIMHTKLELSSEKYQSYMGRTNLGKIERFSSLVFLLEIGMIILLIIVLKKSK